MGDLISIGFTVLAKGTIRRMFQKHAIQPKLRTPLDLPLDPTQCVHVDEFNAQTSISFYRCGNHAIIDGPNGFLCEHHQDELLEPYHTPPSKPRNIDDEVIQNIIQVEARALRNTKRERVRTTARGEYIEFLT